MTGIGRGSRGRIRSRDVLANLSWRLRSWHTKSGVHKYQTVFANQFPATKRPMRAGRTGSSVCSSARFCIAGVEVGLSGGSGRLTRTLSQALLRLPVEKFPAHIVFGTVLS